MNAQSAPAKTAKGMEEIEHRRYKLDHRMRALLLTVNGKTTVGELMKNFERYGDVVAMLKDLLAQGFIEDGAGGGSSKGGADIGKIKSEIAALVYEALGPGGDAIAGKIEGCKSHAELKSFMASKRETLEAALGKTKGGAVWARVAQLLG